MSVSILEAPDAVSGNKINSVERPLYWDVQSNRVTEINLTVTSIADDGFGYARYGFASNHEIQVGDTVHLTGVSNSYYNISQTVTDVNAATIVTDLSFGSAASGGNVQRLNSGFTIKATVYKGDLDPDAIISIADDGGSAELTVGTHSYAVGDTVAVSDTTKSFAITGISNSGSGKALYSIGTHAMVKGDVITVAGVTADTAYNGVQEAIFINASSVVTSKDYTVAGGAVGTLSYQVYDGVHTVTAVTATTITIDEAFDIDVTGNVIKVTVIAPKFQQEITEDGNNLFRFNIANLVKSELGFSLATIGGTEVISPNTGSITNYTIQFIEQFDDADGVLKDGRSIQTSVDYKGANIALQHTEVQNLNIFTVDNNTKRFLTNTPTANFVGDTDSDQFYQSGDVIQMHFLHTAGDQVKGRISEFDDAFTLLNAGATDTPLVDVVICRGIIRIDTGAFNAATTLFTVELVDAGGAIISESYRYCLDAKCYPTAKKVVFFNRYGGFDNYWFVRNLTETVTTKKTMYQKGLPKNFISADRGESTIGSKSFDEREIWSTWLDEGQTRWLEELYTSKHVYLVEDVNGSDDYVPIFITDRRQVMRENDNMTQIRIKYRRPELVING